MNYTAFHRESNNFNDILSDPIIKKALRMRITCTNFLIVELDNDKNLAYMMLKYGDDVVDLAHFIPDRSPIPDKDYTPKRKQLTNEYICVIVTIITQNFG